MRKILLASMLIAVAMPTAPALGARTASGYAVRTTIMRAGPDRDYPIVRRIGRDARVSIHGCLRDRSWCDTSYKYDRGWIRARDLVVVDRGRRLGISSYLGIGVLTFMFGSYWDNHYRSRPFYNERQSWERRYYDNHQPQWGPRPSAPPIYQRPAPQPIPRARPVPDRRDAAPAPKPNRLTPPVTNRHENRRMQQSPAPKHPNVKTRQGPVQQDEDQKHRGKPRSDSTDKKHDGQ